MKRIQRHIHFERLGILAASLIIFGLETVSVLAGDLTTDNLTVNRDATFRGNLNVVEVDTNAAVVSTNGLVLYYSFNTNSSAVIDDSGHGYTGTVYGATWVTNGISGGAYSFDGVNDYIGTRVISELTGSYYLTVAGWMKMNSYSTYVVPFGKSGDYTFQLTPAGYMNFYVRPTSASDWIVGAVTPSPLYAGTWYHIVGVFNGTGSGTSKIYIDGQLKASITNAPRNGVGTIANIWNRVFTVGCEWTANSCFLNGSVDELRVYNRSLSDTEVRSLYLQDAHLVAGTATVETDIKFKKGINYIERLGDVSMGDYTNRP